MTKWISRLTALVMGLGAVLHAQNNVLTIADVTAPRNSTGNTVAISYQNAADTFKLGFTVKYDPALIQVTAVNDIGGDRTNPSPFTGTINNTLGEVFVRFDFNPLLDPLVPSVNTGSGDIIELVFDTGNVDQATDTPLDLVASANPSDNPSPGLDPIDGTASIVKPFNAAGLNHQVSEDAGWTQVDLTGAFTDDGGALITTGVTITNVTDPANGQAEIRNSGTEVWYRPTDDSDVDDTFDYTATHTAGTDTATVTVDVVPVDDPPTIDQLYVRDTNPPRALGDSADPLLETGNYEIVFVASDKDTALGSLNPSAQVAGGADLTLANTIIGNDNVTFFFTFPVGYSTVQHPNQTKNFTVNVAVNDNVAQRGSDTDSIAVTVKDVDRPPEGVVSATITPAGTATTTQDLTANANLSTRATGPSDPDGDQPIPKYSWTQVARVTLDGQILSSSNTKKGDTWQVTIGVATDPYGNGEGGEGYAYYPSTEGTAQVDIVNTDPVLANTTHKMFIQMPEGTVTPPITKTFNLSAAGPSDPDEVDGVDTLKYVITSLPTRGTLSYSSVTRDPVGTPVVVDVPLPEGVSQVTYTVTDVNTEFYDGNDGPEADSFEFAVTDEGTAQTPARGQSAQTAVVTVEYRENQPPEVDSFAPSTAAGMDETVVTSQTFNVTFTDDNDPSGNGVMDTIEWSVSEDGGNNYTPVTADAVRSDPLSSQYTFTTSYATIYNGIDGSPNQDSRPASKVFKVRAVGIDTQQGVTEQIWDVTVDDVDRLPTAPTVAITPKPAYTGNDLVATVDDDTYSDPDGDPLVDYSFGWEEQLGRGQLYTDTLTADNTAKDETWQVSARARTNPYGVTNGVAQRDGVDYILGPAATDSVTISNSPPVANDDEGETDEDTAVELPVVDGPDNSRNFNGTVADTDDDTGDNLTIVSVTQPGKGSSSIVPGSKKVGFDPAGQMEYLGEGQTETVTFTYTITDNDPTDPQQSTATVSVLVNGVNDDPVADSQTATTEADTSVVITLTGSDDDQNDNLAFLPDFGTPVTTEKQGSVVIYNSRTSPVLGSIDVEYTPPQGFIGVDTFTFEIEDDYEGRSEVATVTIVVGTPLWYPYFELNDLLVDRPGLIEERWYHVEVVNEDEQTVVDTGIYGTAMDPIDYFRAGSEGLLPGDYMVYFETWNPGTGTYGGEDWSGEITVTNYGRAEMPTDLDIVPPPVRDTGNGPGPYQFKFRAINGRGYVLNIYRNDQLYRTYRNVFLPDETGKLIPLNALTTLEVDLEEAGDYEAEVRGFNPLDESVEGNLSRGAPTEPLWADFAPFTIQDGGNGDDPDEPEGQVFPNGDIFVAPSSIEITLQWNPIPDAVGYRLYLGAGNAAPIYDGKKVGDTTSWRVNVPLGSYIWQVVGVNAAGNGIWSAPYVFDVVRDASAPLIRRVSLDDLRSEGEERFDGTVVLLKQSSLLLEYAPDSVSPVKVDIQHYQTVAPEGWKVYNNVQVNGFGRADGDGRIFVSGADFTAGDYILIKAYAADGKKTGYRVFVIE